MSVDSYKDLERIRHMVRQNEQLANCTTGGGQYHLHLANLHKNDTSNTNQGGVAA